MGANESRLRDRMQRRQMYAKIAESELPPVSPADVRAALVGLRAALELANINFANTGSVQQPQREVQEAALREVELARLVYEEKSTLYSQAKAEEQIEASNALARTNTQLAGSQMWVAFAMAFFTLCQVLIAVVQACTGRAVH